MSDPNHPPDTYTAHTPEQARRRLGQPFQQVLSATMRGEVSASEATHDAELPPHAAGGCAE